MLGGIKVKDKLLYLVLGILIGAVITAGCFMLFSESGNDTRRMENPPDGNFVKGQRPNDGMLNQVGEPMDTNQQSNS